MSDTLQTIMSKLSGLEGQLAEAKKVRNDHGFSIRTGEDPMTSRKFSVLRVARAMQAHDWRDAKIEGELCSELRKRYEGMGMPMSATGVVVPLTSDLPFETQFRKHVGELTSNDFDPEHAARIRKDLSTTTATSGATLVGSPGRGELIDHLRAQSVFLQAGVMTTALPAAGSVIFPAFRSDPTTYAVADSGAITESTPTTGEVVLSAKGYKSLIDVSQEFLQFSLQGGGAAEGVLREIMARGAQVRIEQDVIAGQGGTAIKGLITFSGTTTRTATTTAADGDTLGPLDPSYLVADAANSNVSTQGGVFLIRPRLWARLAHRRADAVSASDAAGPFLFGAQFRGGAGGDAVADILEGHRVFATTLVSNTRAKGSGTALTLLFWCQPRDIVYGTVGVGMLDVTSSDASKFASGINTLRFTQFVDAAPLHEESVAFIDTLLETT